jgi:hypothetical protein
MLVRATCDVISADALRRLSCIWTTSAFNASWLRVSGTISRRFTIRDCASGWSRSSAVDRERRTPWPWSGEGKTLSLSGLSIEKVQSRRDHQFDSCEIEGNSFIGCRELGRQRRDCYAIEIRPGARKERPEAKLMGELSAGSVLRRSGPQMGAYGAYNFFAICYQTFRFAGRCFRVTIDA